MHQGRILKTQRLLTPDLHSKSLIILSFRSRLNEFSFSAVTLVLEISAEAVDAAP
jgi:hypothetical protein